MEKEQKYTFYIYLFTSQAARRFRKAAIDEEAAELEETLRSR